MNQTASASHISIRRAAAVVLTALLCCATGCGKNERGVGGAKQRGFPGYTLVQQLGSKVTALIDSEGKAVHRWISKNSLAGGTYLLKNGNLLRSSVPADTVQRNATPGLSGMVELLDWDGNQLWSFTLCNEENCLHHDIEPLPNGNILMLGLEQLGTDEQIALGRDPARAASVLKLDYIIEMKPEGKEGGKIVWEWHLKDHLIQDFDKSKKNYGVVAANPGKVDINFIENLRKTNASSLRVMQSLGYVASTAKITPQRAVPDWTHANGVAYHPVLDQILISVRSLSEIWIIDHGTTTAEAATSAGGKMKKGGELLYRWGNPQSYQSGAPADQQLYGQHDAQWIAPGSPGEGNILIFNNGEGRKEGEHSSIEEIITPLKPDGGYEWMEGEAFAPEKPAWRYVAPKKDDFASSFLSGVQRQPNGNTLICSGVQGRMFEVTQGGEIAWEHKMDITMRNAPGGKSGGAPGAGGRRPSPPGGRPGMAKGPGMGAGKGPGFRAKGGPAAQPAATAQAPAAGGAESPKTSEFTAAELAVLSGKPLQPPAGLAGAGAGAGRGPGGPGGGPPGGGGLFRATRYGLDFPAFKGRTLKPLPPLPPMPPRPAKR